MLKVHLRQREQRALTPKTASEGVIFGQRLRELRLARDMTQRQLADGCGSNSPFISNLERGVKVPSLTMVLRLADALGCRVYELVEAFDQRGPARKRRTN
jgi:transcriptional regulator with XRE-family HTH domain